MMQAEKNLNMTADQINNPGPANYNPGLIAKKMCGKMKERDLYIKDDLKRQSKEKDKFVTPGPGIYETRKSEHVGTVLINQKSTFSKIKRDMS